MSYQLAVSAWLLAAGPAATDPDLRVAAVRPEGFEDIDCALEDGSLLLVQTKERGPGARAIGISELAEIIAHAAQALRLTDQRMDSEDKRRTERQETDLATPAAPSRSRFAVVTDGRFADSLGSTGWGASLAEALAERSDGAGTTESLIASLRMQLDSRALAEGLTDELLARTHLVILSSDVAAQTMQLLQAGLSLHPSLASIARAELLRDLTEMAARQRSATLGTAERRTRSDLDALVGRLRRAVDVGSLEEAIRAGVCEPADYVSASPVDKIGFFDGVDVTPAHIAAGLDVLRPEETTAILDGLAARRHVVIAGPSGSGKSALVWRTARLVERGPRVLRVLRVADAEDVELLLRQVDRLMPSDEMPVLVCADNLGRAHMAAWPAARARLGERPGVLVLGAARNEELTPELTADATVVDPRLTDTAAGEIYDAISAAGLPTELEREEALQGAGGLLMEFIALTTTGRRLRDVLAVQVAALADSARRLQREALRLVCAAHTLGFAVSADALPAMLGADPDEIGDALERLAGEHLLVATGHEWRGLHDLRTEVLLDLLHTAPPPTLASTYSRAIALLPRAAHASAARRAAVRLARATAADHADLSGSERLASLHLILRPLAEALAHQMKQLEDRPLAEDFAIAPYAAGLLEAADRLDTVAYAHAVLPLLEQHRPSTLDVPALAFLVYSVAVDGLTFDIDGLRGMVQLARLLPERSSHCAHIVGAALRPAVLAQLATSAEVTAAVRLCEAAENTHTLTPKQATEVYRAHIPVLPQPPGDGLDIEMADRRAQLTATLASLAQLRGPAVADALGTPMARAEDAVASDPYGCHVETDLRPTEPAPAAAANLARDYTYDAENMLVIRAVAFARTDDEGPGSAYRAQPGEDEASVNAQVVLLARRLFDACPEADLINAELWGPNRRPVRVLDHEEGVKNLRSGVLPRACRTARSVAFQAAVTEAVSAENWTTRLRSQAELAHELVGLLQDLPAHIRLIHNRRRRLEWSTRVEQVAARIAALPGRPAERQAVFGTAQTTTLARTAADLDEEMRVKDHARAALDLLAGVLVQVARGLDDRTALRGAGFRIAEVPERLRRAREQGAPRFEGVGDTLPETLDSLASFHARLLTGLEQAEVERALRSSVDMPQLDRVLTSLAQKVSEHDRQVVLQRLSAAGVTAEAVISPDPKPMPPWQDQQAVVVVGLDDWVTAVATLQEWTEADRLADDMSGKVIVLALADETLMPMGLRMLGAHGKVLPLPDEELADISTALALPLHTPDIGTALAQLSRQLMEFSYERVRQVSRGSAWQPFPGRALAPQQLAEEVSTRFAAVFADADSQEVETSEDHVAVAARAMLALCEAVSAEDGRESGLAHQLADIDITALTTPEPGTAAYLFNLAHAAALQADRGGTVNMISDEPTDL